MINNIYWVGNLHIIGGVETCVYELAKLVKNYDFVVYYRSIPKEQLKRLKKYVKCIKYEGEKLKCKKLFMNYDISIIDNVEAEEYIEVIHAVFTKNVLKPHVHDKITKYYAVSIEACEGFKKLTGKECEVLHNPLHIEKPNKILKLISATRLASDKGDIARRMQQLVDELERTKIPYEYRIFTNGQHLITGKNVIYMEPTVEIRDWIADSDYLVQLSDTEAFCYSVLEALYLNVPVIVTPIPCFNEMHVETGKNGYILDFNMKNIPIFDIYYKIPKFEYQPMKDEWLDIIEKVEGNYKEEVETMVKVQVIMKFNDLEEKKARNKGEVYECSLERANYLVEHNAVKILEEIKEEPKIEVVIDEEKVAEEVVKDEFAKKEKPKYNKRKKGGK